MDSVQLWVALLVTVIVVLLAWLGQRQRDALPGGPEFRDETPAPHARPAPHLLEGLPDEVVQTNLMVDLCDEQKSIARLQHDNRVLRELLAVTLSHIRELERKAGAEGEE